MPQFLSLKQSSLSIVLDIFGINAETYLLHKSIFICIVDAKKLNYLRLEIVDLTGLMLTTVAGIATKNKHR